MALNTDMLAQLMLQFAKIELVQLNRTIAAQVTSDESGNVTVTTVSGPLTVDDEILSAMARGFAKAVVLHLQSMGQVDPVLGKIF